MSGIDFTAPAGEVEGVAADARTLADVLRLRAGRTPEAPANFEKRGDAWHATSWRELHTRARRVAAGFVELGIEVGDRVAILGPTHADWGAYDLGAHVAGLVTVGIYPHQSAEQVGYLLEHSESRAVFVADEEELRTVLAAAPGNRHLRAIVPWTVELAERFAGEDERVLSPERFRGEPLAEDAVAERQARIDPAETAILIYTSGTTGPPKGAMITHANILALLRSQPDIFRFRRDDLLLSFLPMAHATERVLAFYLRVSGGVAAAYATSIGAVLSEILEVRPTVFGSVPRLFEKAYARVHGEIERKPAPVRAIFDWAVAVGRRRTRHLIAGEPIPFSLALRYKLAHRLVFAKVQAALGGRVRACITGAAPTSLDILEFFWAAGLPVYEGYGMTEATVLTHITREGAVKLGTVGKPIPPCTCKIAGDGEILLGGPFIFKGYYKNPEASREALAGGWLHTGDVGEIDGDGFLRITDRKKHLIITAGGKNVAPANIERAIKTKSPMISQVHAHGDRRSYISALIAPSPLETLEWGAARGLLSAAELAERRAELLADPTSRSEALERAMGQVAHAKEFQRLFIEPVREGNRELARVERVRRFAVLDRDFSVEGGELTPTMKMKRKVIEEKYAEVFDRIYDDEGFAIDAGRE
jgi:long-chain acyl-CoA synthetase